MSISKRIFAVVLAACLLTGSLSLVACHGRLQPLEEFNIDVEFDETKPIEISFWAKNENNAAQVDVYKKAVEDFEALYPNTSCCQHSSSLYWRQCYLQCAASLPKSSLSFPWLWHWLCRWPL